MLYSKVFRDVRLILFILVENKFILGDKQMKMGSGHQDADAGDGR